LSRRFCARCNRCCSAVVPFMGSTSSSYGWKPMILRRPMMKVRTALIARAWDHSQSASAACRKTLPAITCPTSRLMKGLDAIISGDGSPVLAATRIPSKIATLTPHKGQKNYVPSLAHTAVLESNLQKERILSALGLHLRVFTSACALGPAECHRNT
jgi:hypothetical protein